MRPSPPLPHASLRGDLRALYAEVDDLLVGWACDCSRPQSTQARCCQFALTGREPHPTPIELEEVRHAMRAAGIAAGQRRRLPVADQGACPLLSEDGRCRIYSSRPFGCRTFFCDGAESPFGSREKLPRHAINAIGRRIADLAARFAPRDPHPRPLVRALADLAGRPRGKTPMAGPQKP